MHVGTIAGGWNETPDPMCVESSPDWNGNFGVRVAEQRFVAWQYGCERYRLESSDKLSCEPDFGSGK
jgi:hypothetical protein